MDDVEKGITQEASNFIKDLLHGQKERQKDHNPLSPSISRNIYEPIRRMIPRAEEEVKLGLAHGYTRIFSSNVKARYMYDLFQRLKSPPEEVGTECVNTVHPKLDRIKACYDDKVDVDLDIYPSPKVGASALTYLMVVDACYILELIYKWLENKKSIGDSLDVKYNLVHLDNQIPFFVLQDIFECTLLKLIEPTMLTPPSLPKLILAFLEDIIPFEANIVIPDDDDDPNKYKHILDLVYQCYKPQDASSSDQLSRVTTMFSARELAKAGVKFNPNPDHKWKLDMKFTSSWGNATLTMPPMRIEESTACVLCNLAAYERVFPEVGNYITSYVFAMKTLLDTEGDVLTLVESNIFRNQTGHGYVVFLIHNLWNGVVLREFLYAKEWQKMGKYCNSGLGWTRRTYFSGAWSYIASISALILFILTAIQTYCSIRTI